MTALQRWSGMMFQASPLIPEGMQMLWNEGHPVVCVPIGAPIEDAVCDEIWLHPSDYDRLRDHAQAAPRPTE